MFLIIGRKDLNAHRVDGDALMDQRAVAGLSSRDGLDIPGGKPPVGIQLLPGDGVIPLDADALRDGHIQAAVIVEIKIVDLDIEQILLSIDPIVAAADGRRDLPALPGRAELIRAWGREKVVLLQKRTVVVRQNIVLHSPPCNEQAILCNDQAKPFAGYCWNRPGMVSFVSVSEN